MLNSALYAGISWVIQMLKSKKVVQMVQDTVDDWQSDHVVLGAASLPVRVVTTVRTAPRAECCRLCVG